MPHSTTGPLTRQIRCWRDRLGRVAGLPFAFLLASDDAQAALQRHGVGCRDRLFTPLLTLAAFVGQVFDRREVRALLESHEGGRRNEEMRIWTLLCLEVWYEQFRGQLAGQTTNLTTRDTAVGPGR